MVSPQTSILLNPTYSPSTHIPLVPSGSSLANSSSNLSSSRQWQRPSASSAPRPSPRIRFAAFPDPRRGVLVTDEGDELPLDYDEDQATLSTSAILGAESLKFSEASAGTFRQADIHLPGISPASSISTPSSTDSHDSYLTVPRAVAGSSSTATPIASTSTSHSPYSTVPISRTSSIASSIYTPSSGIASSSSSSTPGSPSSSTTWKKIKPTKFLAPFLRRSSSPCPPVASQGFNISAEELFTLGAINLFRTESRESAKSGRTTTSLRRWSSGGSGATSDSGADTRFKASASTAGKRRSSASSATGARMLNGRVYGAAQNKAHLYRNKNPFANVPAEPDFVEWGYGGMGAVQSSSSSSSHAAGRSSTDARWSKLQGGTSLAGGGGGGGDDDDDGSGAAWVRKRREAREKEKKAAREKAEAEAAQAQAQQGKKKQAAGDNDTIIECARESSDTLLAAAAAAKKEGEQKVLEGAADVTVVASPVEQEETAATAIPSEPVPLTSADEPEPSSSALVEQAPETVSAVVPISEPTEEVVESSTSAAATTTTTTAIKARPSMERPEHHVSSAYILPSHTSTGTAAHHHHHHQHHHHHHTSRVVLPVTSGENTPVPASSQLGTPKGDVVENPIGAAPASMISSSTDESDEEEEEDNGEERERSSTDDEEEEEEEEEEEVDEDEMEKRRTALGAGVEKYTRHSDKE